MTTAFDPHSNLAFAVIVDGPSPPDSGDTLTVQAGKGALFPQSGDGQFNATVMPPNPDGSFGPPDQQTSEIVRCSVSGDTFTIERAQEGTTAKNIAAGWLIVNSITVKDLTDIENAIGGGGASLTVDVTQPGHGLDLGLVIRIDGGGDYVLAQADSPADAEVAGIVVAVADADHFTYQYAGVIDVGFDSLATSQVYFLDPNSAGGVTNVEPTGDDQISKPLLIALSATTALLFNWRGEIISEPGPGEGVSIAKFACDLTVNGSGVVLGLEMTMPVDPVSFQYGSLRLALTAPPFTYGADTIAQFSGFIVQHIDTSHDGYDLAITIQVLNLDGTEQITLTGFVFVSGGVDSSGTIEPGDITVAAQTGSDLSYESGTGNIVSAAGGNYAVVVTYSGGWD